MGRKPKFTKEDKTKICKEYLTGFLSYKSLADKYGCGTTTIRTWINQYKIYGDDAFEYSNTNSSYTTEFKKIVAQTYLNGEGSLLDIANKYGIPSQATVLKWTKLYNNHMDLKNYKTEVEVHMIKNRKTTFKERIEIVKYCLNHDKDYTATAAKYNIPYANVYNWVQKYIKDGETALIDNRGRKKNIDDENLTELEKKDLEIAKLKHQLEMKEIENKLLKKLDEIERRR